MKNLKFYVKDNAEKLDPFTTSVTLEKRHRDFIHKMNLNLSKIVRDLLDDLMGVNKNEKSK